MGKTWGAGSPVDILVAARVSRSRVVAGASTERNRARGRLGRARLQPRQVAVVVDNKGGGGAGASQSTRRLSATLVRADCILPFGLLSTFCPFVCLPPSPSPVMHRLTALPRGSVAPSHRPAGVLLPRSARLPSAVAALMTEWNPITTARIKHSACDSQDPSPTTWRFSRGALHGQEPPLAFRGRAGDVNPRPGAQCALPIRAGPPPRVRVPLSVSHAGSECPLASPSVRRALPVKCSAGAQTARGAARRRERLPCAKAPLSVARSPCNRRRRDGAGHRPGTEMPLAPIPGVLNDTSTPAPVTRASAPRDAFRLLANGAT